MDSSTGPPWVLFHTNDQFSLVAGPWRREKKRRLDVKWSRLLLGVDFGGERLVGLGGCSLDPALGCVEPR